ncbi:hypothetical protein [Rhizobium sp. FKL33]|uniref:hypothetical protein n=1 Tax=Rhizobium sp. FKL33 TaxID=2562307 RepID=UPI0010BF9B9E|nr:hypothetical protein [Rhizobium sp. FKL33]
MNDNLPAGLIVDLNSWIDKFERELDEKFKPALAKAIHEVVGEFLGDDMAGCVQIRAREGADMEAGFHGKAVWTNAEMLASKVKSYAAGGIVGKRPE